MVLGTWFKMHHSIFILPNTYWNLKCKTNWTTSFSFWWYSTWRVKDWMAWVTVVSFRASIKYSLALSCSRMASSNFFCRTFLSACRPCLWACNRWDYNIKIQYLFIVTLNCQHATINYICIYNSQKYKTSEKKKKKNSHISIKKVWRFSVGRVVVIVNFLGFYKSQNQSNFNLSFFLKKNVKLFKSVLVLLNIEVKKMSIF